jgi:hypothetical protein
MHLSGWRACSPVASSAALGDGLYKRDESLKRLYDRRTQAGTALPGHWSRIEMVLLFDDPPVHVHPESVHNTERRVRRRQ